MADRLVDLQRHLLAAEDERGGLLGALRRARAAPWPRRRSAGALPGRSISRTTSQPARAVLAAHAGVAAALRLAVADGGGVHHRAALHDVLVDAAALARREPLLRVPDLVRRLGERDAGVGDGGGDADQQVGPLGDAHVVERVHLVGVGPARLHDRRRREVDRRAGDPGAGPRHLRRPLARPAGRRRVELRAWPGTPTTSRSAPARRCRPSRSA